METLLNFLTHTVIIVGILAYFGVGAGLVLNAPGSGEEREAETALRVISVIAGFLVYYSSRALGISIPDMMFTALASRDPIALAIMTFIGPVMTGLFVSNLCIKRMEHDSAIAGRITLLIMVLTFSVFVESYIATYKVDANGSVNFYLMPNVAFVLTVLFYAIFYFKPGAKTKEGHL